MRNGKSGQPTLDGKSGQPTLDELKGSIAEELYDVLYYVCALANIHGVNLEKTHELKEVLNKVKYNR
ncbi:nucleotide pyrophosphohydrolase [Vibrio parahaemolyticus]|nr:nucleotide pyrophosphohydrolase [Vibrio parahaemolyticus]MCF9882892.1 nucleotide pyrophosphohydrolase [Vibrio parahaemolyticus]